MLVAIPDAAARARLAGWVRTRGRLTGWMQQPRYVVLEADDGERAWAAIASSAPAIVILDTRLNVVSSLELCQRVRQDPAGH